MCEACQSPSDYMHLQRPWTRNDIFSMRVLISDKESVCRHTDKWGLGLDGQTLPNVLSLWYAVDNYPYPMRTISNFQSAANIFQLAIGQCVNLVSQSTNSQINGPGCRYII